MPKIPPFQATQPRRRHFLKIATVSKGALTVRFSNGETSDSRDAASFFQVMDDRNKTITDVYDAIFIGRQCDPFKDWKEITRIADSFSKASGTHAAAGKDELKSETGYPMRDSDW